MGKPGDTVRRKGNIKPDETVEYSKDRLEEIRKEMFEEGLRLGMSREVAERSANLAIKVLTDLLES